MTIGDLPLLPCGHYQWPSLNGTDILDKCSRCSMKCRLKECYPVWKGTLNDMAQYTKYDNIFNWPNQYMQNPIPLTKNTQPDKSTDILEVVKDFNKNLYNALGVPKEFLSGYQVHDEVMMELPMASWLSEPKPVDKISIREDKPMKLSDWKSISGIYGDPSPKRLLTTGRQVEKSTSIPLSELIKAVPKNKCPELHATVEKYNEEVLRQYTQSQQRNDTIPQYSAITGITAPARKIRAEYTAKEFKELFPEASSVWSQTLKKKIEESKQIEVERKKVLDGLHWNPYEGWDD